MMIDGVVGVEGITFSVLIILWSTSSCSATIFVFITYVFHVITYIVCSFLLWQPKEA